MNEEINSMKGREFICSCGKNYLSYAALFTHIKQKHDGKVHQSICRHPAPSSGLVHKGKEVVHARTHRAKMSLPVPVRANLYLESEKAQNGISKLLIDNNNIE